MKKLLPIMIICSMFLLMFACREAEEGVDDNNDIIVRNTSEQYLYIKIDGSGRGRIENDGIAENMWESINDGVHVLEAFYNSDYTGFHCTVTTDYLNDGEDFNWYLRENDEYEGTKEGDC